MFRDAIETKNKLRKGLKKINQKNDEQIG